MEEEVSKTLQTLNSLEGWIRVGVAQNANVVLKVGNFEFPLHIGAGGLPRDFQSTVVQWRQARNMPVGVPTGPYSKAELQYAFRKVREEYLELKLEVMELIQSTKNNEIEFTDGNKEIVAKILHEAADLLYTLFNVSAVLGFDLTEVFDEVATSNDTKNGGRKYGNITKGDAHIPADINAVVDRQIAQWKAFIDFQKQLEALPEGEEYVVGNGRIYKNTEPA